MSIQTGSVRSKASGEEMTDSLGAHWLSFGASNGPRSSQLGALMFNSPHWSALGASMSNRPGSLSALDQPVATSAAPLE